MDLLSQYESCSLCPRRCHVNRSKADRNMKKTGYCGQTDAVFAARAALHQWEEPVISGVLGSGTVFFSGCTLRCCFCQNHAISQEGGGKEISVNSLAQIFLRLQDEGAHNINLVTATHFLPSVVAALDLIKHRLTIPVVYNCGGYERTQVIKALADYVDIWLPDLKYESPRLSARYSGAKDYFAYAQRAIRQMVAQTGAPEFVEIPSPQGSNTKLMTRGVIIRHMVLPGAKADSIRLLHWIKESLPTGHYLISLLSQYTPFYHSSRFPEINRPVTTYEYQQVVDAALKLGLHEGFMQKRTSAKEEFTPSFNLEGLGIIAH